MKTTNKKLNVAKIAKASHEARVNTMVLNHGEIAWKLIKANPNAYCDCSKCRIGG